MEDLKSTPVQCQCHKAWHALSAYLLTSWWGCMNHEYSITASKNSDRLFPKTLTISWRALKRCKRMQHVMYTYVYHRCTDLFSATPLKPFAIKGSVDVWARGSFMSFECVLHPRFVHVFALNHRVSPFFPLPIWCQDRFNTCGTSCVCSDPFLQGGLMDSRTFWKDPRQIQKGKAVLELKP